MLDFDDDRPDLEPFGPGATGWLLYTPTRMAAVLSRADRPPLDVPRLEAAHRASDDDKARAFDSYLSYAGTWRLESTDTGPVMVHAVTEALVPNIVGLEQRRHVDLAGDRLVLSYRGGAKTYRLSWTRTPEP